VSELDKAFSGIIGSSEKLIAALDVAAKAARTSSTVLLQGESGTGKSWWQRPFTMPAREVRGPFVKVNCPGIPSTLWKVSYLAMREVLSPEPFIKKSVSLNWQMAERFFWMK
jgi:transcriptional regulator with GAF, ATPase, and Fis domain